MVVDKQYIVIMIIVLFIIIITSFAMYRAFLQKIIREKTRQNLIELEHQKEITRQYINVQESERERIAQAPLHDDVILGLISFPFGSIMKIHGRISDQRKLLLNKSHY